LKVVEEIRLQIDRERRENARLERDISNRKDQMNFFAQKGGHMRDVARKMREAIEELEEQLVEMRHEDKTIAQFRIPSPDIVGPIVKLGAVSIIKNGKPVSKKANVTLKKGQSLLISGPNGVGKTTFLKKLAVGEAKDVEFGDGVTLGFFGARRIENGFRVSFGGDETG
jgi:ATP-binding cassette subfamily F protein 3